MCIIVCIIDCSMILLEWDSHILSRILSILSSVYEYVLLNNIVQVVQCYICKSNIIASKHIMCDYLHRSIDNFRFKNSPCSSMGGTYSMDEYWD